MIRTLALTAAFAAAFAAQAIADDKKIIVDPPGPAPTTIIVEQAPELKSDAGPTQLDPKSAGSTAVVAPISPSLGLALTEQEAKTWIDKPVYSSDGKNVGEVVDFQRDADKKIIGMHADMGGYFGFWQTRVNLAPAQFKLQNDRVLLDLTAAQAEELPKVEI
jgi:PRC-barrel domain